MKLVTKNRIDTVEQAGKILIKKSSLQIGEYQRNNHLMIGQFMLDHPEKILKLIIKTKKRKQ